MLHISFSLHITSILQHTCVPVVDSADNFGDNTRESLRRRFEKLLVVRSVHPNRFSRNISKMNELDKKLKSLQKQTVKDENSLEKNLHLWLSQKVAEGGSGLTKLDKGGLGTIHFAAALGYDWAIEAIIVAAEMKINLRDNKGWTALHGADDEVNDDSDDDLDMPLTSLETVGSRDSITPTVG